MKAALASFSIGSIVAGAGMIFLPAALIVAGLFGFAALYVLLYMEARR